MRTHRSSRRGSNLIEFALLLPLFLTFLAISLDYGWYFFMRAVAQNAVRAGCRAGAVVPPDEGSEDVASESIASAMSTYNFFGIECGAADESRCGITVSSTGTSPEESISCDMVVDYPGMTGLVPMPETVHVKAVVLYELQR